MSAAYPLSGLAPRPARGAAFMVAALHLALVIALLQMPALQAPLQQAVLDAAPLMVSLMAAPAPTPARSPAPTAADSPMRPPLRIAPPPLQAVPVPAVELPPLPARPAAAPPSLPAAATNAAPVGSITAPSPPVTPAPAPPPPPPAARKQVAADALRYLVPPPAELPLASRRAGESGVVWLRVVVDVRGLPAQVQVQRSSGFPRLDTQAVAAMRQARFRPHTEDGQAVEVEVLAPIEYSPE